MPKSKHRRKAGGKSVQHPGRRRCTLDASTLMSCSMPVWDATFDPHTPAFHTASKAELFQTFVSRIETKDGNRIGRTLDEAEAALRYLVEKEMVVVDGAAVSTHPRFAYLVGASGDSPARMMPMRPAKSRNGPGVGAFGGTRTPNLQVRSLSLYPVELRTPMASSPETAPTCPTV
jgi:hypothetical protein